MSQGRTALLALGLPVVSIGLATIACAVFPKRYENRPDLSPAPAPLATMGVTHCELTPLCGADTIVDAYRVDSPAAQVEEHYSREMSVYSRTSEGWQPTFTDLQCTAEDGGIQTDCRYAACVIRDQAPSLYETFSVEIISISPTETYVTQRHSIYYLERDPPDVQCGE